MRRPIVFAGLMLLAATPASARIDSTRFGSFGFRQHPGAALPLDAEFKDEGGHSIRLQTVMAGRPSIVVLEYLRCHSLCSLVLRGATNALIASHLTPGQQVNLIAVSIDPRDTAKDATAERAMYAARFPLPAEAMRGIHFLTGSKDEVARLADAIGFPYQPDNQSGQFAHPAGFVVATPKGRISRYLLGLNPPAAALGSAISEAQAGNITPAAHPLLLLCFGYDPDAGTVAALAMHVVRLVSLAVLLILGTLIALMSLRRRTA